MDQSQPLATMIYESPLSPAMLKGIAGLHATVTALECAMKSFEDYGALQRDQRDTLVTFNFSMVIGTSSISIIHSRNIPGPQTHLWSCLASE